MLGDFYSTLLMDWIRFSFNSSFRASKTKSATSKPAAYGLNDDVANDLAVNVGQAKIAAAVSVGEFLVIDS